MLHSRVVAIKAFCLSHVMVDYVGVLAVCHDRQLCLGKELLQDVALVYKHIACA